VAYWPFRLSLLPSLFGAACHSNGFYQTVNSEDVAETAGLLERPKLLPKE